MQVMGSLRGTRMGYVGQPHSTWYRNNVAERDALRSRYCQWSPEHPSSSGEELWCRNAYFSLQLHGYRDEISPAHSVSMLQFPACRRRNSIFLLHGVFQMYGLILQCLLLMKGGQILLGEREQGKKPLLVVLSFLQKMGMRRRLFPTPQGLQEVCNDSLPLGLNIFQQPVSSTSF